MSAEVGPQAASHNRRGADRRKTLLPFDEEQRSGDRRLNKPGVEALLARIFER